MFYRNSNLKERAQKLRRGATKEENHLWYDFLRGYPIPFRRQMVIQNYIVDFYCPTLKLVIELDGSQHYEEDTMEYDSQRTAILEALGCRVIRYSNSDIKRNFRGVCEDIDKNVKEMLR
jgi:very-short-patch-repair endonuclease